MPAVPPSVNDEQRAHYRVRARRVTLWRDAVTLTVRSLGLKRDPLCPCIVSHTFRCRGDGENRAKYATDGLVAAGLLHDDRWPWLFEVRIQGRPTVRGCGPIWECVIQDCDASGNPF